MSDSAHNENQPQEKSRREFFKGVGGQAFGLGAGALALSVLGNEAPVLGAGPGQGIEIWSTNRQALLLGPIQVPFCDPCDCPPVGQFNWDSATAFRTTFDAFACDELTAVGVAAAATMSWSLDIRRIRENGPLDRPIGSFQGRWRVTNPGGSIVLQGNLSGTIGFDPCLPETEPRCEQYPLVVGSLFGRGVPGQPTGGCSVRWSFCGKEGDEICDPTNWDVGVTGVVECPCD